MSRKTDAANLGMSLFAHPARDLKGKPEVFTYSWYVLCNFRHQGREIGFEWHQANFVESDTKVAATEFMLMDAGRKIWLPHAANEAVDGSIGADADRCRVTSSFGTLAGDEKRLTLQLDAADGALDIVLTLRAQTMYNGMVGVLPLWGRIVVPVRFSQYGRERYAAPAR
ncbi:MAG: hypothetical protein Q4C79_06830 [Neisseria sp.]|uniref:hypothetical protein n=1 Tax=Neisseria sp. TaxID=192066 RepID=UPI0026DD0CB2|nr:hypothetical protein [Neisseria sp.]MDO4248659.1 hypothetical protein [Neisseria sp.]